MAFTMSDLAFLRRSLYAAPSPIYPMWVRFGYLSEFRKLRSRQTWVKRQRDDKLGISRVKSGRLFVDKSQRSRKNYAGVVPW
jgi:hypothetical protein